MKKNFPKRNNMSKTAVISMNKKIKKTIYETAHYFLIWCKGLINEAKR